MFDTVYSVCYHPSESNHSGGTRTHDFLLSSAVVLTTLPPGLRDRLVGSNPTYIIYTQQRVPHFHLMNTSLSPKETRLPSNLQLTHSVTLTRQLLVGRSCTVLRWGTPGNPRSRKGTSNSMSPLVMPSTFSMKLLKAALSLCRNSRSAWRSTRHRELIARCPHLDYEPEPALALHIGIDSKVLSSRYSMLCHNSTHNQTRIKAYKKTWIIFSKVLCPN